MWGHALALFLFGAQVITVNAAHAEHLSIPNCPAALALTLPNEFRPIERAPGVVHTLSANPMRRTHYAVAFTSRSLGEDAVGGRPYIAIGSLGSVLNAQGRLKHSDFDSVREAARKSQNEIPPGAEKYIGRLVEGLRSLHGPDAPTIDKPVPLAYMEPDDHSFVTVGLASGTIRGDKFYSLSFAKLIFAQSCFVYVNAGFPLGLISFKRVTEIASELDIR
jgi:hypothetical protein